MVGSIWIFSDEGRTIVFIGYNRENSPKNIPFIASSSFVVLPRAAVAIHLSTPHFLTLTPTNPFDLKPMSEGRARTNTGRRDHHDGRNDILTHPSNLNQKMTILPISTNSNNNHNRKHG